MSKKPSVAFLTLGCKVNQYDADAMRAVLDRGGFRVCDAQEFADVYVINTCAVTAEAERKSRQAEVHSRHQREARTCGRTRQKVRRRGRRLFR